MENNKVTAANILLTMQNLEEAVNWVTSQKPTAESQQAAEHIFNAIDYLNKLHSDLTL